MTSTTYLTESQILLGRIMHQQEQAEGFMEEGSIDYTVAAVHATNVITEV